MGNTRNGWWAAALAGMLALAPPGMAANGTGNARPALAGAESIAEENADLQTIWKAMRSADADTLAKLYQDNHDPVIHVWSAMALERVHFNLDAATADASACESALLDVRPAIALSCGQFRIGNLQLAGRWADSRQAESELVTRFRGHGIDPELDKMQAWLDSHADEPLLSYDIPVGDVTLPLKQRERQIRPDDQIIPRFTVSANGHELDAILDTGASDLVMGQDDADRLGVKPLDRKGHVNGWLAKDVPTQAGILETLALGGITLHNVPVTVVPRHIVLIGGNLVAPLGTLEITQSNIHVFGKDAPVPACDTAMRVSSAAWGGNIRLYPQLLAIGDARYGSAPLPGRHARRAGRGHRAPSHENHDGRHRRQACVRQCRHGQGQAHHRWPAVRYGVRGLHRCRQREASDHAGRGRATRHGFPAGLPSPASVLPAAPQPALIATTAVQMRGRRHKHQLNAC